MKSRPSADEAYMNMATQLAERSHAIRKKVGCIIVQDIVLPGGHITKQTVSDGYNGTPHGQDNACEVLGPNGELITKEDVLHAEFNALMKLCRTTFSSVGATMYVTLSPCKPCARMIQEAFIKRVVFKEQYRDDAGIRYLIDAGISVTKLEDI